MNTAIARQISGHAMWSASTNASDVLTTIADR